MLLSSFCSFWIHIRKTLSIENDIISLQSSCKWKNGSALIDNVSLATDFASILGSDLEIVLCKPA